MILIKNIHTVCPRRSVPFFIVNTIENGLLLLGHTVPSLSVVLSILYSEVRFDKMDKTSLTPSLKKCFTNWSETHAILYLLQIIIFYFHFTVLSTIVLCVKEVLSNSTEGKILRKLDNWLLGQTLYLHIFRSTASLQPKFCQKYCLSKHYSYSYHIAIDTSWTYCI